MPRPAIAFSIILAQRLLLFAMLWWVLTGGRQDALLFGAPFVVLAASLSALARFRMRTGNEQLRPGRVLALIRLTGFFLWNSLRGGIDVSLRAFRHPLPLEPDLIDYPLRLPPGPGPILMAGLVSLMPGTLAVICEGRLRVHVLDRHSDWQQDLERLEQHIAAFYHPPSAQPRRSPLAPHHDHPED
jgi:multicomponent Na+:H+ antiporter subunit E